MVERSIFHGIFSRPSVIKLMEGCKNDFHGERYRVQLERVYKWNAVLEWIQRLWRGAGEEHRKREMETRGREK